MSKVIEHRGRALQASEFDIGDFVIYDDELYLIQQLEKRGGSYDCLGRFNRAGTDKPNSVCDLGSLTKGCFGVIKCCMSTLGEKFACGKKVECSLWPRRFRIEDNPHYNKE